MYMDLYSTYSLNESYMNVHFLIFLFFSNSPVVDSRTSSKTSRSKGMPSGAEKKKRNVHPSNCADRLHLRSPFVDWSILNFFFLLPYLGLSTPIFFFLFSFCSLFALLPLYSYILQLLSLSLPWLNLFFPKKKKITEKCFTMAGVQPVAFYSRQVPPGGVMVPSLPRGASAMVSSAPCSK